MVVGGVPGITAFGKGCQLPFFKKLKLGVIFELQMQRQLYADGQLTSMTYVLFPNCNFYSTNPHSMLLTEFSSSGYLMWNYYMGAWVMRMATLTNESDVTRYINNGQLNLFVSGIWPKLTDNATLFYSNSCVDNDISHRSKHLAITILFRCCTTS